MIFEVTFTAQPCNETITDVLSGLTADIGFESFVECENGMKAYIQQSQFDEAALQQVVEDFPIPGASISYSITEPEDKNWNEEWERNFFQPIVIDNRCVIHSTFHKDYPKTEYDIVINPQMAFGTGHHETTSSILGELLEADLKGKSVLDMGCGTSILAILASMRGAGKVTAIDIDDWCVNNSRDNIALNGISNITVELGDASLLNGREPFDVVIANINRNILLQDMPAYAACMKKGSELYISGFYTEDIPVLREKAACLAGAWPFPA
jgi:ribosomal protein L11 methyltransferase